MQMRKPLRSRQMAVKAVAESGNDVVTKFQLSRIYKIPRGTKWIQL